MVPCIIRRLAIFILLSTLLSTVVSPVQSMAAAATKNTPPAVPIADVAQTTNALPITSHPALTRATQSNAITTTTTLPHISAGWSHTCVINGAGRLTCWGYNSNGETDVPSDLGAVSQVSAGEDHTCAITRTNALRCWGNNYPGQVTMPDLGTVSHVSAGRFHMCAVTSANVLRCWGADYYGQATVPSDLGAVSQVSAGDGHTCAVTSANALRCWGAVDCAATSAHALRCWGAVDYGQATVPSDLGAVSQVSAGDLYTCAVTSANVLRCWGNNSVGQATVPSDPLGPSAAYAISGSVRTHVGVGVADVTVGSNTGLRTTTAADGSFTLTGVAPGSYTLTPTKIGYIFTPATLRVTVAGDDLSGQDFIAVIADVDAHIGQGYQVTGNDLTLTITTGNNGPKDLVGAIVEDPLPEPAPGTTWTWTCTATGGADCGTSLASTASQVQGGTALTQVITGTGNIKQRIGILPVSGTVAFTVTGTLNNIRQWSNTPVLILPSGIVNTQDPLPSAPTVGQFQVMLPLIRR